MLHHILTAYAPLTPAVGGNVLTYAPNPALPNLTSRWHSAVTNYNAGPPEHFGVASGSGRQFVSIDNISGENLDAVDDVDVLVLVDAVSILEDELSMHLVVRGSGDDSTETGYVCTFRNVRNRREIEIVLYQNGAFIAYLKRLNVGTVVDAPGQYYYRVNVTGASPVVIKLKIWKEADPEPAAWNHTQTVTGSNIVLSGRLGFGKFTAGGLNANRIMHFGVGLNGEDAPLLA